MRMAIPTGCPICGEMVGDADHPHMCGDTGEWVKLDEEQNHIKEFGTLGKFLKGAVVENSSWMDDAMVMLELRMPDGSLACLAMSEKCVSLLHRRETIVMYDWPKKSD